MVKMDFVCNENQAWSILTGDVISSISLAAASCMVGIK
jgi:hypothetical protein